MISENETRARREVIETARAMANDGLSVGTSGNVSCRWDDGMLVTPSGVPYDDLVPGDIVFVASDGTWRETRRKPSSEWRFHLAAFQARPDDGAVVHCHSLNATALACAHKPIPAFHYMVAVAGGTDIPLVPYATFGTATLAAGIAAALRTRKAALMANHGQIACGRTLTDALDLAQEVENLAAQYVKVLELGEPKLLSGDEMDRVIKRFSTYGKNAND